MRIGFDVDDVVADLHPVWLERINKANNTTWQVEDITQWDFWKDIGVAEKEIYRHLVPELYDEVRPVSGALAVVTALRNLGHGIVYITSCPNEQHWNKKFWWLNHFGFYRQGDEAWPVGAWAAHTSKAEVGRTRAVDWLVDDSVKNCEDWPGMAFLVVKSHNKRSLTPIKRLKKLEDLMLEVKHAPSSLGPIVMGPVNAIGGQLQANPQGWVDPAKGLLGGGGIGYFGKKAPEDLPIGTKPSNPKDIIGSDKMPLHLWPETATLYGTLGMLEGALKYGRNNFRAVGVRASIYIDAARRHLNAWASGEELASDSGLPHLGHALACLAILVEAIAQGNLEDDRDYKGEAYLKLLDKLTPEVKRLKAKYVGSSPKHYTKKDNAL